MMTRNRCVATILATTMTAVAWPHLAFAQAKTKATIGIHSVEITPSIRKAVAANNRNDQALSLERVAESMGQQLIDRIHNTRKFTVVSRSDLNTILKDQDLQSVLSDPSDINIARAFQIAGCKYALIVTIDDFQDRNDKLEGEGGIVLATKRTVRLSSVLKIYDTTSAKLLESTNFQLSKNAGQEKQFGAAADGKLNEDLLTAMAREMCQKAANRVVEVIFPAKILMRRGEIVTINRGDGTGIAEGQTWTVFALGEALIDPDTGENLGSEEIAIGKIKITGVKPKTSQGVVLEDYGIDKGQVLRRDESDQKRQDR